MCTAAGRLQAHPERQERRHRGSYVETIGCSGMTHSAAMASEILPGKTVLKL